MKQVFDKKKPLFSLYLLIFMAFFLIVCWSIALFMQSPTQSDWIYVKEALKLSEDTNYPLFADWDYDYWIETTQNKNLAYKPQTEKDFSKNRPLIALTKNYLEDCNLVKEEITLYRKAIYVCN